MIYYGAASGLLDTWLNVNERNEYKLLSLTNFSRPANLTTYTILSLFSLQVELAPRLLST